MPVIGPFWFVLLILAPTAWVASSDAGMRLLCRMTSAAHEITQSTIILCNITPLLSLCGIPVAFIVQSLKRDAVAPVLDPNFKFPGTGAADVAAAKTVPLQRMLV